MSTSTKPRKPLLRKIMNKAALWYGMSYPSQDVIADMEKLGWKFKTVVMPIPAAMSGHTSISHHSSTTITSAEGVNISLDKKARRAYNKDLRRSVSRKLGL